MASASVLIFAPLGRDAALIAQVLRQAQVETKVCRDADELLAGIAHDAGAALLTEEALFTPRTLEELPAALAAQPSWSSLPLVLLQSERPDARRSHEPDMVMRRLGAYQGVIWLQRPLSVATVVSIMQAALAARQRQYQVRDLLAQLAALNSNLEAQVAERTAVALRRAEQLRELSGELLLAEEREQRRFAEILHDDLQQLLMAASLNAQMLLMAKTSAKKDELGRELIGLIERSAKATRSWTVELSAPVLYERGLAAALQWLAEEMSKHHRVEITVAASADDNPQAADLRIFFFRAVRELLFNALKYGQASPVRITMQRGESDALCIIVADEGPGFDPATLATRSFGSGGFGLVNIRQRAALLGGELRIDSAPGCGTRMTLLAPVPPREKTPGVAPDQSFVASDVPVMASLSRPPASRLADDGITGS